MTSPSYLREKVNDSLDPELLLQELSIEYKTTGTELQILCPFHNERTASCYVSEVLHIFSCFGCHVAGDLVYLAAKIKRKSIEQTVYEYANKLNISFPSKLEDVTKIKPKDESIELRLVSINEDLDYCEFILKTSISLGRLYYQRMITFESMSSWAQNYYYNESSISYYEMRISDLEYERDILIEQQKSHQVHG